METEKGEGKNIVLSIAIAFVMVFFVIPVVWNFVALLINEAYKLWFNKFGKCIEAEILMTDGRKEIVRMTRKEARELGINL